MASLARTVRTCQLSKSFVFCGGTAANTGMAGVHVFDILRVGAVFVVFKAITARCGVAFYNGMIQYTNSTPMLI
jgi:hypothetical protein